MVDKEVLKTYELYKGYSGNLNPELAGLLMVGHYLRILIEKIEGLKPKKKVKGANV